MKKEDIQFDIQFYESVLKRLPKDFQTVEMLGHLYTSCGELGKGMKMDELAVQLRPESPLAHYNLACSLALMEQSEEALTVLDKAVNLGYDDLDWLLNDEDLLNLHAFPGFIKIVNKLKTNE